MVDLYLNINFISTNCTDYVFDGNKKKVFFEYDKPFPKNKYGLTKLRGEKQITKIII